MCQPLLDSRVIRWAAAVCAAAALLGACSTPNAGHGQRSPKVRAQFLSTHACPATGQLARSGCPGFEVDHIVPLCAGGADAVHNLQWLSIAEHRAKTRLDRAGCRQKDPSATMR